VTLKNPKISIDPEIFGLTQFRFWLALFDFISSIQRHSSLHSQQFN